MAMHAAGQITLLRRGVMSALAESGISGVEILTCAVSDFRPIMWMAPPIYPLSELEETLPTMFSGYRTITNTLNVREVLEAYNFSMKNMESLPYAVFGASCVDNVVMTEAAGLNGDMGRVVFSSNFSKQDGLLPEAGAVLTMELVATLTNAGVGVLIKDENNFHVILDNEQVVGVVDGQIHGHQRLWPTDLRGQIELQLMAPRGVGWTTKTLDVCDRLYFWLMDNSHRVDNLDGVLDALTYLKAYGHATNDDNFERYLLEVKPRDKKSKPKNIAANRLAKITAAAEIMEDIRVPDNEKIVNLFNLLVPDVMSEIAFARSIWDMSKPVFTLQARVVTRIQNQLFKLKNKVS